MADRRRLAGLLVALAACGGGAPSNGPPVATGAATTTVATTAAVVTTTTTAGEADDGIGELELLAPDLLVEAEELGAGAFVDAGFAPPGAALPCDAATAVDEAHPADAVVGAGFDSGDGATAVEEVIRVYGEAGSTAPYDTLVAALAGCGTAPVDVTAEVAADAAIGVDGLVVARVADAIVTFRLVGPAPADLDVTTLAAFGVGKVLAALGE